MVPFWARLLHVMAFKAVLKGVNATAIGLAGAACVILWEAAIADAADRHYGLLLRPHNGCILWYPSTNCCFDGWCHWCNLARGPPRLWTTAILSPHWRIYTGITNELLRDETPSNYDE